MSDMKRLLVLGLLHTLAVVALSATAEQKSKNCNEVRAAYSSKGFNVNDVPNKGVNGECGPSVTFQACFPDPRLPKWGSGPLVVPGEESWVPWLMRAF